MLINHNSRHIVINKIIYIWFNISSVFKCKFVLVQWFLTSGPANSEASEYNSLKYHSPTDPHMFNSSRGL